MSDRIAPHGTRPCHTAINHVKYGINLEAAAATQQVQHLWIAQRVRRQPVQMGFNIFYAGDHGFQGLAR